MGFSSTSELPMEIRNITNTIQNITNNLLIELPLNFRNAARPATAEQIRQLKTIEKIEDCGICQDL